MAATPPPTSRGEQAKAQLIASAIALFGEKGLYGATTREIAQHAGQNIAAIPYYFNSKEGLYLAVAHWIADFITRAYRPLVGKVDVLLSRPDPDPEQYRRYIQLCFAKFAEMMTRPETLHLSQIISREQLSPTAAYTIIHQNALSPLHRRITRLVAGYTGCDPDDTQTIVHTHALLGEALSFRVGRATLLQQTGWPEVGPAQVPVINQVLAQHIDWLLNGLRTENTRKTGD